LQNQLPQENKTAEKPNAFPPETTGLGYRDIVRIALFAALIAVLGLVPKFDLPLAAGVPITVQTLGVMLAGLILGARNGALAVLLFLFVVALGAPVLSGGRGGLGVFFGPTVGFLIGWVFGAFVVSLVYQQLVKLMPASRFMAALLACLIGGIVVIYAFGIPGLAFVAGMEMSQAFMASLFFLPGDIMKSLLVAWLAARLPLDRHGTFGASR
jgi:biotin transport system substrate-specific component